MSGTGILVLPRLIYFKRETWWCIWVGVANYCNWWFFLHTKLNLLKLIYHFIHVFSSLFEPPPPKSHWTRKIKTCLLFVCHLKAPFTLWWPFASVQAHSLWFLCTRRDHVYSMRVHVFLLFSRRCEIATDSIDIMSEEPSSLVYSSDWVSEEHSLKCCFLEVGILKWRQQ